jgi:D-methionine transport system ATP-binding protein
MIELHQLEKTFITPKGSFTALSDINLQVGTGEIFGIIGKSGAGKSTLIRCVNLLEKPTSGKVIVAGKELTSLATPELRLARRKIGMIFQHFNLLASRNVYDNIALPLELSGYSKIQIEGAITPLLELTGLTDKKLAFPSQLSGGQKQRVAIARALASKPNVLLSDEATSALDPETTTSILQLLKNIRDTLKLTILLITHEMSVIKACCDRVAILEHGKLIEENEVGEFFSHPKTAIAKKFIQSSLPQHLPSYIEQYLLPHEQSHTHPVLRFWFMGDSATQPIISQLINQFNLRLNILQANVECIKNHTMGIMIVAIAGEKANIQAAMQHLTNLDIQTEVIGHVPVDIIPFN